MRSSFTYISWSAVTVFNSLNSLRSNSRHLWRNWYTELPVNSHNYSQSAWLFLYCQQCPQLFSNYYWHGYVLHEGITYKSRVPLTSQMTSRLLCHTAAAMRAHNMLCNSYNTRPLLCARITYYVTVIIVEINYCSFRRVHFAFWHGYV
jgi:hypothetical protein